MGITTKYYQLQRYKKDYYVPNKNELKKLKSLITLSLILLNKNSRLFSEMGVLV